MKKNLLLLLFTCMAALFPGCEKSTHGGGPDDSDELPEYAEGALLTVELDPEEDGFDYYVSDGETDICILNNQETLKPAFAIVQDRATKETFSMFFSENGYPLIYEHNGIFMLLNNFSGTKADMGIIDGNGEIIVHRGIETGVDWDSGFYEFWNSPSTRAIDWGRLGELYLDEVRLIMIGVGYGVKAIPAMAGMMVGDKLAYVNFAKNFVDVIDEAIPGNKYIEATKLTLDVASTAALINNAIKCKAGNPVSCLSTTVSGLFDVTGEVIVQAARKEEQIKLGDYVLMGGHGSIQVTLRWNNVNDIDLHVTDPNGETIYWDHKNSVSGGYLDYDNRISHGPENIFWHEAELKGNYFVYVHHYYGSASANYTVYIDAFGHTKTVRGEIDMDEKKLIAMFDENGINTNVSLLSMNKSTEDINSEKKSFDTDPYYKAKTMFPDLQKIKDRIIRNKTNTN
ncbi:MAG: hypothetical protein LBP64_05550 [Tannerella sp.]|jgi:hypothetical protein|nr:hypothetical protein [Tannerella sp.]